MSKPRAVVRMMWIAAGVAVVAVMIATGLFLGWIHTDSRVNCLAAGNVAEAQAVLNAMNGGQQERVQVEAALRAYIASGGKSCGLVLPSTR